jgi:hypothetical protein
MNGKQTIIHITFNKYEDILLTGTDQQHPKQEQDGFDSWSHGLELTAPDL